MFPDTRPIECSIKRRSIPSGQVLNSFTRTTQATSKDRRINMKHLLGLTLLFATSALVLADFKTYLQASVVRRDDDSSEEDSSDEDDSGEAQGQADVSRSQLNDGEKRVWDNMKQAAGSNTLTNYIDTHGYGEVFGLLESE
ncbi:hypothetical protein ElyMa_006126300 [Elysia marginata]|uniref:RxLR effector protein n=1 Tax=Elysia marginata TaxID=1093978 RepID=A0AAV4GWN1_9GAST|nr:hypothetical protein ElyMa_006126300 [Elysia marginata]